MKTLIRLSSLILVAVIVLGASRLWAENKEKKPTSCTRIAVLNLTFVIKNYEKLKHFQEEIKDIAQPFQIEDRDLREELDEVKSKAAGAEGPNQRKKYERRAKDIQSKIKENNEACKLKLVGRNDEGLKIIYKDVEEAVERYADAHGLDLVMAYNDSPTEEDRKSVQNIVRKINTGALMPIYMASGIDISTDILTDLNQRNSRGE